MKNKNSKDKNQKINRNISNNENSNNNKVKNTKEKNNKGKKKKSKVRIFFGKLIKFILILLLIVALSYGGWFGYKYYQHVKNEANYDPLSATALGINPTKLANIGRINVLVLGESGVGDGYKLTDSIMLVSYNPQTQQASILSIPRDTYVGKRDKTVASSNYLASYKMNAVYRNGSNIPETVERVSEITGIEIDKYVLIDTDAIIQIIDEIGGVTFNVPIDMDYDDPTQDLHIHLKAGEQLIDGSKAEQLLRFRHNNNGTSYPTEYGDNDLGRMKTQRNFIQATLKQLIKFENVTKVLNLINIVFDNIQTDLDMQTMKYYIPYAFKFNMDDIKTGTLPGVSEKCNGVYIYSVNKKETVKLVDELFTDIVLEEKTSDDDNANIKNANSNNKTNEIDNSVVSNSQKEEKITIELLNGSDSENAVDIVKDKLEKEGYIVSKIGKTNVTTTSTIINRTMKSTIIEEDLKEILGIKNINKSSNNSKTDFTIIIGKDYK